MTVYKVFNENNVLTKVSDEDLDLAARQDGPLSTALANAAPRAGRHDLANRLVATLDVGPRLQRLAAANALLELGHADAAPVLETLAPQEADGITAAMFRAIALRLGGVAPLRGAWESGEDPELCALIPSMYNSQFTLNAEDIALIVTILHSYMDRDRPWLKSCPRDEWRSEVFILVKRISADAARPIRASLEEAERERLRDVLRRVATSGADSETKMQAKRALVESSAG